VNYYDNAVEAHEVAELLYKSNKYRFSMYKSCLAMELYLKSRLQLVDDWEKYEFSHDIINIYRHLTKRFTSSKEMLLTTAYYLVYNKNESWHLTCAFSRFLQLYNTLIFALLTAKAPQKRYRHKCL